MRMETDNKRGLKATRPEKPDIGAAVVPVAPPSYMIYATLFAVHVCFTLWFFVAKYAMAQVVLPPLVFAAYREVMATLIFVAMVLWSGGSGVSIRDIKPHAQLFFVLGFLMFMNVAGFIIGLSMVTSFNCAILQPTQPVFASLVAWVFRYESMSCMKFISIVMACSGAALTVYLGSVTMTGEPETGESGKGEEELNPPLGNSILLVQCMCGGAMWVVQKRVLLHVQSPMVVTAISYAIASVLTVTVTVFHTGILNPVLYVTSPVAWAAIAYAALLATVFTYYAMAWANKWANPSTVTLSLCLQPLLTALFSSISGGPPLLPPQALSCGLIIAGLCVKVYDQEKQLAIAASRSNERTDIELPLKELKPLIK